MVRKITDSTAISISLVIPLIGGVFWLSQVHSKARSADEHAQNALAHVQSLEAGLMKYKESEEKKDDENDEEDF